MTISYCDRCGKEAENTAGWWEYTIVRIESNPYPLKLGHLLCPECWAITRASFVFLSQKNPSPAKESKP